MCMLHEWSSEQYCLQCKAQMPFQLSVQVTVKTVMPIDLIGMLKTDSSIETSPVLHVPTSA